MIDLSQLTKFGPTTLEHEMAWAALPEEVRQLAERMLGPGQRDWIEALEIKVEQLEDARAALVKKLETVKTAVRAALYA